MFQSKDTDLFLKKYRDFYYAESKKKGLRSIKTPQPLFMVTISLRPFSGLRDTVSAKLPEAGYMSLK